MGVLTIDTDDEFLTLKDVGYFDLIRYNNQQSAAEVITKLEGLGTNEWTYDNMMNCVSGRFLIDPSKIRTFIYNVPWVRTDRSYIPSCQVITIDIRSDRYEWLTFIHYGQKLEGDYTPTDIGNFMFFLADCFKCRSKIVQETDADDIFNKWGFQNEYDAIKYFLTNLKSTL